MNAELSTPTVSGRGERMRASGPLRCGVRRCMRRPTRSMLTSS